MNIPLKAISLSHKKVPLEVRELFAMNSSSLNLLQWADDLGSFDEMLVISTCNRFEVYFTSDQVDCQQLIKLLKVIIPNLEDYLPHFKLIEDPEEVAEHLFRVALGLESQVLGDAQIINQVKTAYQQSVDLNLAGPFLHRLLHTIFRAHKRVTHETRFKDYHASVAQTTKHLVEQLLPYRNGSVLVLGVGKVGAELCKKLSKSGYDVWVSNRTPEKSLALATQLGLRSVPINQVPFLLDKISIVISAISVKEPLLTKRDIEPSSGGSHKYFIDLSVPRSIAPDLTNEPNITLLNMDHIDDEVTLTLQRRVNEVPKVEAILRNELTEFFQWSEQRQMSPTIHKMKAALEKIRQEEIAKHLKHLNLEERMMVNDLTKSIVARVVKLPVLKLKIACKRGEDVKMMAVLDEIFDA